MKYKALLILTFIAAGALVLQAKPTLRPESKPPIVSQIQSQPNLPGPSATPNPIVVGVPTEVTVRVPILDSRLVTGSVNLLRLGPTGTQPTGLGVMHDDGINGDVTANDKIFSFRITVSEKVAGQLQLQVSAAYKGILRRVFSPAAALNVWSSFADTALGYSVLLPVNWQAKALPPGSAGTSAADQVVSFGSTFLPDGVSSEGIVLLVSSKGEVAHPETYSLPPFDLADCVQMMLPSGLAAEICEHTFDADIVSSPVYVKTVTAVTAHNRFEFTIRTPAANMVGIDDFNNLIATWVVN